MLKTVPQIPDAAAVAKIMAAPVPPAPDPMIAAILKNRFFQAYVIGVVDAELNRRKVK